jgi:hypothetical protein
LREPLSKDSSVCTDGLPKAVAEKRNEGTSRTTEPISATPESINAIRDKCYEKGQALAGLRGRKLVTKALGKNPAEWVLERLDTVMAGDDDIGHALWIPGD